MTWSDVEDITDQYCDENDPASAWNEAAAWYERVHGLDTMQQRELAIPGLWEILDDNDTGRGTISMEEEISRVPGRDGSGPAERPRSERLCEAERLGSDACGNGDLEGTHDTGQPSNSADAAVGRVGRVRGRNRLQATAFFLTYSQSKLSKEQVKAWMSRQPRIKRCIVAEEHHLDGNIHFHSLVEYERAKDVTTKYFDILTEHPNIQVWTNRSQTYEEWMINHWNYCLKEDEDCFKIGHAPESRKRKRDELYAEAFKRAAEKGVDDAVGYLKEYGAYDLCTKYQSIEFALYRERNKALAPRIPARSVDTFTHPPMINPDWRNLYISGPTGCGKTAYARALLPEATVVSHRDQLRDCDFSKGVIFDDFDVGHWPPTAVIHLLDWEEARGIDVKHAHVVIPAKTRKIFTHNRKFEEWIPQEKISEEQIAAMRRRVDVVNIHTKLF